MANSTPTTTNSPTSLPNASVHHRSTPPTSSKETRGGGLRGGGVRECNFSEKESSKKRSLAAAAAESYAQQTTPTHQQKKPKASSNDHHHHDAAASLSSWCSSSFGASSTTAAQTNDDTNGTFGPPASLASKPSPPQEEPNVNPFQCLDKQSATTDLSSSLLHSHSSSISIPTIKPSSCNSCCIKIPELDNNSRARSTFLTTDISNQILQTEDNLAFMNIFGQLGTMTHNEDVRGGEDGQKKPFNNHILIRLNGHSVLRVPPYSDEILIIKRLLPQSYKDATRQALSWELFHYYSADGRHHDCLWHGFEVSLSDDLLWYSEVGIVSENEELLRNHIAQRMNALAPASRHWSGLLDLVYSCDIALLQTIASGSTLPFLRGLSATEWRYFNLLVQASRELTQDESRSRTALPNAIPARNDTQASASFGDVEAHFSDVLARFDPGVFAFISPMKHDMGRITMWDETALTQLCSVKGKGRGKGKEEEPPQRCLEAVPLKWQSNAFQVYALVPKGQLDRLITQLRLVTFVASIVFSPTSLEEAQNLLQGIYWRARKIRQQFSTARLVIDKVDGTRDIFSAIIGFVTTNEIPPKPKCVRFGCNNIAAPHPDRNKRGGKYDRLTCNEPACARMCAWHVNGVRCSQLRSKSNRHFCNGVKCSGLYTRTRQEFKAEKRAREASGEVFA